MELTLIANGQYSDCCIGAR